MSIRTESLLTYGMTISHPFSNATTPKDDSLQQTTGLLVRMHGLFEIRLLV